MVSPLPFETSALDFARILLSTYPETSPFDLDPPLPNLRPAEVEDEAYDTEEFKEAARENTIAMGGINPFSGQFGANPFAIPYELQRELSQPFTNYIRPPALNEADIRTELQFLEQIYPGGCVHLFKVRVNDEVRLLKVFPDREIQMAWKSPPTNPVRWYRRERDAYAHLLSYGICAKGIVPMCYGYVNITDEDVSQMVEIRARGDFEHDVADLEYDDELPPALLLEYFEDAETISFRNISIEIADTALRHLREIHTAYVLHGDLDGDNILLLPDGRVVWIDFDRSETLPRRLRRSLESPRVTFLDEMACCWTLFYSGYLPNKRIY